MRSIPFPFLFILQLEPMEFFNIFPLLYNNKRNHMNEQYVPVAWCVRRKEI